MSNLNISQFPAATTADNSADLLLLWQGGTSTTKSISKLNYLGLSSVPVGINDSQTLTNKVLTAPTISSPVLSGTVTGTYTIGGTPTFPSSVVTLTGSQTLTNKVLTSPTINSATISNPTLTVDTVSGYSSASVGTVYGLGVNNGAITPTTVTASGLITASSGLTLSSGTLTLATNAILLGSNSIPSSATSSGTSNTEVTGLSTTVTVPAGGRKVMILLSGSCSNTSSGANTAIMLWKTTVGGTPLASQLFTTGGANYIGAVNIVYVDSPSAGSVIYKVSVGAGVGTATLFGTASPAQGTPGPSTITVVLI